MPASYRTRGLPAIYVHQNGGGFHVLKLLLKGKYYYHVLQQRHHELLQDDCLCDDLKQKLRIKAIYHTSKAIELGARL
jgi:hypothetical protein